MNILTYTIFRNSTDFEKWQLGSARNIHCVAPIELTSIPQRPAEDQARQQEMARIGYQVAFNANQNSFKTDIGIFVAYWIENNN